MQSFFLAWREESRAPVWKSLYEKQPILAGPLGHQGPTGWASCLRIRQDRLHVLRVIGVKWNGYEPALRSVRQVRGSATRRDPTDDE